jgi:hypothetical protein
LGSPRQFFCFACAIFEFGGYYPIDLIARTYIRIGTPITRSARWVAAGRNAPHRCSAFPSRHTVPKICLGNRSNSGGRQISPKFHQNTASRLHADLKKLSRKIVSNVMLFIKEEA